MRFRHELLGEYRAQFVGDSGRLWVTKGYDVYYSDDCGTTFSFCAHFDARWLRNLLGHWHLTSRIIRGGFLHLRPLQDGALLGVVYGGIVRCEPGSKSFVPVLLRPGRSMKIEVTPEGEIFAGEYFYNKQRGPVHVLCSNDGGRAWGVAHQFRPGEIRHIHSIMFDKRLSKLLLLTGDTDRESKVLITDIRFEQLQVLAEGTQRSRAVVMLCTDGGYFMATDTPYEQNYIEFLSFEGEISERCPIVGSCLGGCQVGTWSFFATATEPSPVNRDPFVTLYGTCDGHQWHVIQRWHVDRLSYPTGFRAALFQMGRVIFPTGENRTGYLFGTTIAVVNHDGVLHRWKLS